MLTQNCDHGKRCGNIRTCEKCARARQKLYADRAEYMERQYGQLALTTIVPDDPTTANIKALRASMIRRKIAPSGIWTVETGELAGHLHLNIISPTPSTVQFTRAQSYSELITTTGRAAAAYITKRKGIPSPEQFTGKTAGTFGLLYEYLASNKVAPLVQAASLQKFIDPTFTPALARRTESPKQDWSKYDPSKPMFYNPDEPNFCNPPLFRVIQSAEEARETAARHLPHIFAIMNATRKSPIKS